MLDLSSRRIDNQVAGAHLRTADLFQEAPRDQRGSETKIKGELTIPDEAGTIETVAEAEVVRSQPMPLTGGMNGDPRRAGQQQASSKLLLPAPNPQHVE
jgi:hypothetical protein